MSCQSPLQATIMDTVPSLVATSEGSPSSESTGLLTPDSSPLFRPSHPKETFATRLSKILDQSKPRTRQITDTHADDLVSPVYRDSIPAEARQIKRICVIGAGYVGMYHLGCVCT